MIKTSGNEEIDRLTIELINTTLLRYTIQLFTMEGKMMKPFGSGVLLKTHDNYFILTASHVSEYMEQGENQLYIRVDKHGYINIAGIIRSTVMEKSNGIDLAYIKMDDQMPKYFEKSFKFLSIDKVRKHNKKLDAANYCVLGFPEKNVRMENGRLDTGASFWLLSATKEKPYQHYKLSDEDYFILNLQGKATDMKTGEKKKVNTHFHGISGCGLWYLMYDQDPETLKYSIDYRLIGIMTEYKNDKFFCFIGNKIHMMIEAFRVAEGYRFNEIHVP